MATTEHITTADELLAAGDIGPCELVRGQLAMVSPSGGEHGRVVARLTVRLANHVEQHGCGIVLGAETGFRIHTEPDTVRASDVAFIRAQRAAIARTSGFIQGPPDLAVEVISLGDRTAEVRAKATQWIETGCAEVWIVDPETHTVAVHSAGAPPRVHSAGEVLTGGAVVRGFKVEVADIFGK
jgi:Uma2 family endonuclease